VCAPLRQVEFREGVIGLALVALSGLALLLVWRERERHLLRQVLAMTERVAHLVKTANDIILLLDEDWNIVEANDRAVEKYGYTRDELLQMNVRELRTTEALNDFERQTKQVDTGGMVLETTHRCKDGTIFPIESSLRAVKVEGRRYFQGIIRDITDRKRAELELQRMNRLYAALSQVNETVVRVQAESELFHEVCRVLVECGGFKLASISRHNTDAFIQHGANRGDEPAACVPLKLGGRTWGAVTVYAEDAGMFGDKETVLLAKVAENVSFAMEHLQQETRRREAERWLADKEERFRQMFTSMSSGVAVYEATHDGADFIFRDLNPAGEAITKVSVSDVVGRPVTEVFPGVREMGLLEVIQRVWRTGVAERYGAHLYQDRKLTFWAENFVYRLSTGEIVAVFDDVTAHKQAEAELQRKMETLERFHSVTVDRELQMIELKKEINALLKQTGQTEKYQIGGSLHGQ
jgi:PAS domain S-box-containing protein